MQGATTKKALSLVTTCLTLDGSIQAHCQQLTSLGTCLGTSIPAGLSAAHALALPCFIFKQRLVTESTHPSNFPTVSLTLWCLWALRATDAAVQFYNLKYSLIQLNAFVFVFISACIQYLNSGICCCGFIYHYASWMKSFHFDDQKMCGRLLNLFEHSHLEVPPSGFYYTYSQANVRWPQPLQHHTGNLNSLVKNNHSPLSRDQIHPLHFIAVAWSRWNTQRNNFLQWLKVVFCC